MIYYLIYSNKHWKYAILKKSKAKALKTLLAGPVVDNAVAAEKMLDNMIEIQKKYLGYLI